MNRYGLAFEYSANAAINGGTRASGKPTYGTRLRNPLNGPTSSQYGRRHIQKTMQLATDKISPSRKLPNTYARAMSAMLCQLFPAITRSVPSNSVKKLRRTGSRQPSIKYTRNGTND